MKPFKYLVALLVFWFATAIVQAQDSIPAKSDDLKVKKYTVLGQYEDQMVISSEERLQMKLDRVELLKRRREIIDTLDISERRRRRLLRELYRSPFSTRWDRLVTDLELEDSDEYED